MTKTRVGDPFMSADEFGRSLPKFSTNLLVRNVETSFEVLLRSPRRHRALLGR
jgi:hypothetical protein